jgi:hypothetical protein
MAKVADISTKLSLNNRDFKKGLQSTSKSLGKFHAAFKNAAGKIAKAGALALAAAGVAMVAIIKKTADEIDKISKEARKLDITTEMLTGLGHAAKLSGLDSEKLGKSLIKMTKAVSEANEGLSTQKKAFEGLGISITDLRDMDAGAQFLAIADGLQGVENHSDKVRIAMDIFGRTGGDMLITMEQGAEGIRRAMKEAEHLGITFKNEQGAMVEEANDAMTKLQAIAKGAFNQITIAVAPFVTKWADSLTDMSLSGESMSDRVAGAMRSIISALGMVSEKVIQTRGVFRQFSSESLKMWGGLQKMYERSLLKDIVAGVTGKKDEPLIAPGQAMVRLSWERPEEFARLVQELEAGRMKPSEVTMEAVRALELGAGQDWEGGQQADLLAKFDAAMAEVNQKVADGVARRAAEAAEKAEKVLEMRIGAGAAPGPMTEMQLAKHLTAKAAKAAAKAAKAAAKDAKAAAKAAAKDAKAKAAPAKKIIKDVVKVVDDIIEEALPLVKKIKHIKFEAQAGPNLLGKVAKFGGFSVVMPQRGMDKIAAAFEPPPGWGILDWEQGGQWGQGAPWNDPHGKLGDVFDAANDPEWKKADMQKDKAAAAEVQKDKTLIAILAAVQQIRDSKFVAFAS